MKMRDFCKPLIPLNGCKGTKFLPFLQVFSAFYCNFIKNLFFRYYKETLPDTMSCDTSQRNTCHLLSAKSLFAPRAQHLTKHLTIHPTIWMVCNSA